jgi:GR25 family glycosyltransferase involved in LPS biosynthesis
MKSNSLLNLFRSVYLINLPERTDRLRSARAEFRRLGWQDVTTLPARRFSEHGGFENPGVRGCFHSHLECLRQAEGDILILEDDITFTSALRALTPSIIEQLRAIDWDFVYFGHEDTPFQRATREATSVRFERWENGILCAHFYAVRARVIPRLIDHLEAILRRPPGDPEGGPMPIDGAFFWFLRIHNPDLRTFVANPKLGWQRSSRSDLTPNRLDTIRLFRPLLSVARSAKHAMHSWRY